MHRSLFDIHRYKIDVEGLGTREGLLLQGESGWGEVAPFPGRSRETLEEAYAQLLKLEGELYPSVQMGLYGLTAPKIDRIPVCLLLMGTPQEIYRRANNDHGCRAAKVKIGSFSVPTAVSIVQDLKQKFRLRLDVNNKWSEAEMRQFCSHFEPDDFEFIEDPGCDIAPFPMAIDHIDVWKPTVCGLPPIGKKITLSSTFETAAGLHQIAALTKTHQIPLHALGLGTALYMNIGVTIENGELIFSH